MIARLDGEVPKQAPAAVAPLVGPTSTAYCPVRDKWRAGRALFVPGTTVPQGGRIDPVTDLIAVSLLAQTANDVGEPSCFKEELFWRRLPPC
jgi:hypothetical protein